MTSIGTPLDRVDGPLKVCGQAHYTGDLALPHMVHAVLVTSSIASGRVARIDSAAAERAPGVAAVISHANAMRLPQAGKAAVHPPDGRVLSLLQDDRVAYSNQPVAVVVAETFAQALGAAALVRVTYARDAARLDFEAERANAYAPDKVNNGPPDTNRGDIEAGSRPISSKCARRSWAARSAARARPGRTWCWPRWPRARWVGRCGW